MFIVPENIEAYALDNSHKETPLLKELREETYRIMEYPQMLTGPIEAQFLRTLIKLLGARKVLEVGMFTGYATLSMASALPIDGELITCEINGEAIRFASKFFERSEFGKRIRVMEGPALESIKKIDFEIDFAFIDADKTSYPDYYEEIMLRLRQGGLIVVDNALWSGRVLTPEDDETRAIAALNRRIRNDTRVENVLLTVRDGVNLVRKL
jgi:caffeoyl-CoA O-methyltransferase